MSLARLRKELADIERDKETSGVYAKVRGDDMTKLQGTLKGPEETCYAGGVFVVDIVIPSQYPFEPPKMRFETKMWHPNVSSQTGAICLDILKDKWSPALQIRTVLLSIQALLSAPNPEDPLDDSVADHWKRDEASAIAQGMPTYSSTPWAVPNMLALASAKQWTMERAQS